MHVWSHSQGMYNLRADLALVLALPPERIVVEHVEGAGCYGHNGADDVALDAVLLARAAQGRPVRVQWSRADELARSPFGAAMAVEIEADLDGAGEIVGWRHAIWSNGHVARPGRNDSPTLLAASELEKPFPRFIATNPPLATGGGADRNSVPLYDFPAFEITSHRLLTMPLRTSALRSLGAFANVFAIESFLDELAAERGEDPLALRLRHLRDPRARAVLEAAAARAGWSAWRPREGAGHGIGFARYKHSGAYCAVVAEIEGDADIRVRRLVVAVDVGETINPDGVANQIEGGAIQAASWTLKEAVRFDRTRVLSDAWESYPILTFSEVPAVEVEIVARPEEKPVGAGEAAHGPTAAAIAQRRVPCARRAGARPAADARAHSRRDGGRMTRLALLSGGAAQGLVAALAPAFEAETGCRIEGEFGAVGAMAAKLRAGAPADLLILTAALIAELTAKVVWSRAPRPMSEPCSPPSRCGPATRRRRSPTGCAAGSASCRRRDLFPRSAAGDGRHPFRQGARPARHRRGGRGAPAAVSERRRGDARARRVAKRASDRLHPGHRDAEHARRAPSPARSRPGSSSRPSTPPPLRQTPPSRCRPAGSRRFSPARRRARRGRAPGSPEASEDPHRLGRQMDKALARRERRLVEDAHRLPGDREQALPALAEKDRALELAGEAVVAGALEDRDAVEADHRRPGRAGRCRAPVPPPQPQAAEVEAGVAGAALGDAAVQRRCCCP